MLSAANTPWSGIIEAGVLFPYAFHKSVPTGIIYTCNGGFIDVAHLVDYLELTYHYYHYLTKGAANKAGATFPTFGILGTEGKVTITKDVPDADRPTTAASIAFDQSVFYEISTYWEMNALLIPGGEHNSAFSPEDLVSNYTGTRIGERAINAVKATGVTFDAAANVELKTALDLLKPCTQAQTLAAFAAISPPRPDIWVTDPGSGKAINSDDYLRRRNFNVSPIKPCFVTDPGTGCAGTPAYPSAIPTSFPAGITASYDMEWTFGFLSKEAVKTKLGTTVKKGSFASLIAAMRTDAGNRYGAGSECP